MKNSISTLFICLLFCLTAKGQTYSISTIAGSTTSGYSGDGGAATAAKLYDPRGTAVDGSGNIYIADAYNNVIRKINSSGNISTVAGTGTPGFSGDGGAATAAVLDTPLAVAVDKAGNIYVADNRNHRIRKINTAGIISTVAGTGTMGYSGDSGPATAANISYPTGIAIDTDSNVYFTCDSRGLVRKITASTGTISTVAGTGSQGYIGEGSATSSELYAPQAMALDATGNIYIADYGNRRIRKVTTAGAISTIAGTGTYGYSSGGGVATAAMISNPLGIATDISGNVYFSDADNHVVRRISPTGAISDLAGTGAGGYSGDGGAATAAKIAEPSGLVIDNCGNIIMADLNSTVRKIYVTSIPGITGLATVEAGYNITLNDVVAGGTWSSNNTTVATVNNDGVVTGVSAGTAVITYSTGCSIYTTASITVTDHPYLITTIAGNGVNTYAGDGGPALSASFSRTKGMAIDASGNMYVSDLDNNVIRKISAGGIVSTIAGDGTAGYGGDGGAAISAQLDGPYDVKVDGSGDVYIADFNNHAVRKVDHTTGTITTIAGNGTAGYTGDGGPATAAEIYWPAGLAFYGGELYIAINGYSAIRKINSSGVISTIAGGMLSGYTGDGIPATAAELYGPNGITFDASGNLYICDYGNNRIRKVDAGGNISTIAGTGTAAYSGDGGVAVNAELKNPVAIIADASGNLFFSDGNNSRIRKITTDGNILTVAGTGIAAYSGDGGPATTAMISHPMGLAIDACGDILLSDYQNHVVRKLYYGILPITGGSSVCAGSTIALADAETGGAWSSSNTSLATVDGTTGVVTGVAPGSVTISYTIGSTGCSNYSVKAISVIGSPAAITGTMTTGVGYTTHLSDATVGGTWTSGTPAIADVNSSGLVTGYSVGTTTITYSTGCGTDVTTTVTVLDVPAAITGILSVCQSSTTLLSDATTGGTWTSSNSARATVSAGGLVTGVSAGTLTITYSTGYGTPATATVIVNALPAVSAGSPVSICNGSSTVLTASGAGAGGSYAWSPGSGALATTSVAPTTNSTYTVTGTDANGCHNNSTVTVTVNPVPTISAGSPVTICSGSSTVLTASGAGTGGSYAWSPGSGALATTSVAPTTSTTYTVTGTDANGCFSNSTVAVTVNPVPTISAGSPVTICSGSSTVLTASGAGTGGSYAWSPGSGVLATTSVAPTTSTTYTVTGTDANGCHNNSTVTVTVNPVPIISAGSPVTICSGSSTVLTASGAGTGGAYAWSPGSGALATTSVAPTTSTTYTVTGTDANGCHSNSTVTVTVNPNPTISAGSPVTICNGSSTVLTASGAGTGGSYAWSPGSGALATTSVAPTTSTTYTVTGTDANGCHSNSTVAVTVNPVPTISAGGPVTICNGSSTVLTASGAGAGGSYAWSPGSGTLATTSVTPTTSNTYTVTGTDVNGCHSNSTVTVTVNPNPTISAGSPVTICNGSSTVLTASGAGTGGSYVWSPGSGTFATTSVAPTTSTTYTVTGTDANGCFSSSTVAVAVNPLPVISVNAITVCGSGSGTLDATGAVSYSWANSHTATSTLSSTTGSSVGITFTPTLTNTVYPYVVTGTDANSCVNTYTVNVTYSHATSGLITGIVVGEVSPITVTGDNIYTNCGASGGITLSASVTGSSSPYYTYSWAGSPSATCVGTLDCHAAVVNPTVTTSSTVSPSYTVTVSQFGCTGSFPISIVVPASCTPCDMFTVNTVRGSSCGAAPDECTDCSVIQPFHTRTSSLTTSNIGSNQNYYVITNSSFSNSMTVSGSMFFIAPAVGLGIPVGNVVEFSGCHFFTCQGSFWVGINPVISSAGSGQLIVDNSTLIEDGGVNPGAGVWVSYGTVTAPLTPPSLTDGAYIVNSNGAIYNSPTGGGIGVSLKYYPNGGPEVFPFKIVNSVFTSRIFRCYQNPALSASNVKKYYPFAWPKVADLKSVISASDYDPKYGVDTCTLGPSQWHMYLRGGYTTTVDGADVYHHYVIGSNNSDTQSYNENLFDNIKTSKPAISAGYNGGSTNSQEGANFICYNSVFKPDYGAGISTGYYGILLSNSQDYKFQAKIGDESTTLATGNKFYNLSAALFDGSNSARGYYNITGMYSTITSKYSTGTTATYAGYSVKEANYNKLDFEYNRIYNLTSGIVVQSNNAVTSSDISTYITGDIIVSHNSITAYSPSPSGAGSIPTSPFIKTGVIILDNTTAAGLQNQSGGHIYVNGNTIGNSSLGAINGISVTKVRQLPIAINENIITMSPLGSAIQTGVYCDSDFSVGEIEGNYITGPTSSLPTYTLVGPNYGLLVSSDGIMGIRIRLCGSPTNFFTVQCNHVHETNIGYSFERLNYVNWTSNFMFHNVYGLYLNGNIGAQGGTSTPNDNWWENATGATSNWWTTTGNFATLVGNTYGGAASSTSSPLYVRSGSTVSDPTTLNNGGNTSFLYSSSSINPVSTVVSSCSPVTLTACLPGIWSSSNTAASTVSSSGIVTYAGSGSTTITFTPDAPFSDLTQIYSVTSASCKQHAEIVKNVQRTEQHYSVAPNPTNGSLTISQEIAADGTAHVRVMNIAGSLVYESDVQFDGGKTSIDLSNAVSGVYILELVDSNGQRFTSKMVVEK